MKGRKHNNAVMAIVALVAAGTIAAGHPDGNAKRTKVAYEVVLPVGSAAFDGETCLDTKIFLWPTATLTEAEARRRGALTDLLDSYEQR